MIEIFLVAALSFIASAIGTISGFGTSTIMMPIMMMFYPPLEALLIVSIIHWFNGVLRSLMFRSGYRFDIIVSFGLAGIVASVLGARLAINLDQGLWTKVIAGFLVLYSIYLIINPQFELKFSYSKGTGAGLVSGLLAGLFGMGGAIRGAFLSAFNLPKEIYLANSALILVFIDSARLSTYLLSGSSLTSLPLYSLAAFLLASYLGVKLGKQLVGNIPQYKFRLVIAIMLIVIGLTLFQ